MTDHQPTNQFPAPPPDGTPPTPPSRRSRRAVIAVVVAFVVVLGAGIGVAVAVGTDGDDGLPLGAPTSTTAGSPGAGSPSSGTQAGKKNKKKNSKQGKNSVIRGTVTAESGATWTVKTAKGRTVKVTIGADTRFGTKQAPARAADFPVGHEVAIAGSPATGDTLTAKRVRTPAAEPGGTSTPTPTPSPSSS